MEQFVERFASSSSYPFIRYGNEVITYKEYLETSVALGKKFFGQQGCPTVCVISKDVRLYLYCFMAVLLRGGRCVPIDEEKTSDDLVETIKAVNPDYIISNRPIEGYDTCDIDISSLSRDIPFDKCIEMLAGINPEDEYLVTFTSGTTAQPKGVVHSFGNLLRSARALGNHFNFGQESIFYHNFSVSYMAGILNQFIVPMAFGAQIAVGERFQVQQALRFWQRPIEYGANVFWMSPAILSLLLTVDRDDRGKEYCKATNVTMLVATAPLPLSLRRAFETAYRVPLYESYGLTETLFNATNSPRNRVRDSCAGYILPGVYTEVATDEELILSCDWMFLRYFHETQRNEKGYAFSTGDFAKIDENGLYIIGRKKDLIIKGGMNISPGRIEADLDQFIQVDEFSVIGLPDTVLGEKTALVYVATAPFDKNKEKSINQHLMTRFGSQYTIDSFIRIDVMPRNANGKIDKKLLKTELRIFGKS